MTVRLRYVDTPDKSVRRIKLNYSFSTTASVYLEAPVSLNKRTQPALSPAPPAGSVARQDGCCFKFRRKQLSNIIPFGELQLVTKYYEPLWKNWGCEAAKN